jgi:hypothetical protein
MALYLGFRPSDDPGSKKARKFGKKVRKLAADVVPVEDMIYRIEHPSESRSVFGRVHWATTQSGEGLSWPPTAILGIGLISGRVTMSYHLIPDAD